MSDAPERIWLQSDGPNRFDWTWHWESIGEEELEEVEYIRLDFHDAQLASAREALKAIALPDTLPIEIARAWLKENPE